MRLVRNKWEFFAVLELVFYYITVMTFFFRFFKWIIVLLALTIITMIIVTFYRSRADVDASQSITSHERLSEWVTVDEGIQRYTALYSQPATGTRLVLYRFDPSLYIFKFVDAGIKKTLDQWRRDEEALFVANAVYFDEQNGSQGFLRINGQEKGQRFYDLDKSGLIVLDYPPRLLDTQHTEASVLQRFSMSAQSYPFFIRNGKEAIEKDSGFIARRTFFGIDESGFVYIGIVPEAPVTLFQLMRLLASLPVRWQSVINLDGGPSSGIATKLRDHAEVFESYTGVPNIISVFRKETDK